MRKQKLSSEAVDVRDLAIYELDQFISFMRGIDPDLTVDEATVLVGIALHYLPLLYIENPPLVEMLRETAVTVKSKARKARRNTQRSSN